MVTMLGSTPSKVARNSVLDMPPSTAPSMNSENAVPLAPKSRNMAAAAATSSAHLTNRIAYRVGRVSNLTKRPPRLASATTAKGKPKNLAVCSRSTKGSSGDFGDTSRSVIMTPLGEYGTILELSVVFLILAFCPLSMFVRSFLAVE